MLSVSVSNLTHDILNNDEFFRDTVDTQIEGIGQHRKQECLNSVIGRGKVYLLGSKWTEEKGGQG